MRGAGGGGPSSRKATTPGAPPRLPLGRPVELPGRGTTFVRDLPGPPHAPVVVLLHGWTATADLNFSLLYERLARRFRVVAHDQRGHGRGIRSTEPFRLEDCADDAVALLDVLGVERAIVAGYSMGGSIAQLTWRSHPDRVDALVLCATAAHFADSPQEHLQFLGLAGLAAAARRAPDAVRWLSNAYLRTKPQGKPNAAWAVDEITRHEPMALLEAGRAIGAYSARGWLAEIDVPTAVVVTTADTVVPARRQLELVEQIPGSRAFEVNAGHDAAIALPGQFGPSLLSACTWAAERARTAHR